jgi:transposase
MRLSGGAAVDYSRDHRPDFKQVNIAMVVSRGGLPLGFEVFAGNRSDATTVEEIVAAMESNYGRANRIWVMDRGMVFAENIALLKRGGRRYILGTPRSMLRKFERELLDETWSEVHAGLEVKLCHAPEGQEVFILCRSAEWRMKERAIHDRFEQRIEQKLEQMAASCRQRKQDPLLLAQRLGKLLGRNSRAAGLFRVHIKTDARGGPHLEWSKREDWRDWAKRSEGCYLLRSNVTDRSGEELWGA